MELKSLIKLSAAASVALMATACGDDPKTPDNTVTDIPSVDVCDTCTVAPPQDTPAEAPEIAKLVLVDDFEHGTNYSEAVGNYWYTYSDNDQKNPGASVITTPTDEAGDMIPGLADNGSVYALQLNYTLDQGEYEYDPYVGWGIKVDEDDANGRFGGITYWYKGGAHEIHIETSDVKDYNVHYAPVKASRTKWTQVEIRFKDLMQSEWGKQVPFNAAHINAISFQAKGVAGKVTSDTLFIDNIYLEDSSAVTPDKKDLTISDPMIPTVSFTTEEITVTNPLQETAMKYLNKGVSFTNWLENADGKFKKFDFGDKDVKILADNGFKSIRLPIDLDLYVTNKKEFLAGKAEALAFDDSTLFLVLDSFVEWTKANDMSLVIDYHEYDNSYNETSAKDTTYIKMMAGVWKHVAEHYASNEREDIFYELLNEPDMTYGAVDTTAWTTAAQAIIDSIRTVDTKHTLLFGDVQWYSIKLLAKRTPFTDNNIIYVIHTYEPFVFTHQGGSWTAYGAVKNIPFPYEKEKWSEYSAYFGVSAANKADVLTNIRNYYKNGNKETILNQILVAKKWAAKNNVPLIINEFGALRDKSDEQSVLNYYKAMSEICDTLQIPWTHWGYTGGFSVINKDGKIYDGLTEVMGLQAK